MKKRDDMFSDLEVVVMQEMVTAKLAEILKAAEGSKDEFIADEIEICKSILSKLDKM